MLHNAVDIVVHLCLSVLFHRVRDDGGRGADDSEDHQKFKAIDDSLHLEKNSF